MRIAHAAVIALLAVACFPTYQRAVRRPATVQMDASARADTWNKAIAVLQDEGYVIETVNEAAGLIKTERGRGGSFPCGFASCTTIDVVTVTISPAGLARLDIRRKTISSRGESFESDVKEIVDDVEREQARLLTLITGQSVTVPPAVAETQ